MMGWASGQSQIVYSPGKLPIPVNQSGNSLKLSGDFMGLATAGATVDLTTAAVGAGAGLGGFVLGWITDNTIHLQNC